MKAHLLIAVFVASAILLSGCIGGGQVNAPEQTQVTAPVDSAGSASQLGGDDANVPFIDEGDTVEIGEMI